VRTQDAGEGALALARRQDILARLENDRVTAAADEADTSVPPPATIYAPLPPAVVEPAPAEDDSADEQRGPNVAAADDSFDLESTASTASTVASVLAAAAAGEPSPFTRSPAPAPSRSDVEMPPMQRPAARLDDGVAAHLVADTRVTPARPEPFMPRRRPEFPEDHPRPGITRIGGGGGAAAAVAGAAGLAVADPADHKSHIERDPSVNKSLLLRLIAGVRGL